MEFSSNNPWHWKFIFYFVFAFQLGTEFRRNETGYKSWVCDKVGSTARIITRRYATSRFLCKIFDVFKCFYLTSLPCRQNISNRFVRVFSSSKIHFYIGIQNFRFEILKDNFISFYGFAKKWTDGLASAMMDMVEVGADCAWRLFVLNCVEQSTLWSIFPHFWIFVRCTSIRYLSCMLSLRAN